ncbi:uncharacterized protein LOC125702177 isoform X1 [Lagopus muta]|uniref:uncharacterized protein LOC125702177 isoform X1 n=1 Tax=Lagopus muta TaxID=64668 RepID=UPI00209D1032|nr:uncharacterized protein LOC125702177 isoform X1 [Lagopus muta]
MVRPGEENMDSNVLAIVVAATVSTSLFFVAVLVLLLLLYRRDPTCCQFLCSCRFFQSPGQCLILLNLCEASGARQRGQPTWAPRADLLLPGQTVRELWDCQPPYFSSNQRLVGPQCRASRLESAAENPGMQAEELFCVAPPSSYQLPSWEPRLPSYESVRKKDRQREIHQMIAERFGLWAEPSQELPPPYEHALRHPPAFSGVEIASEATDRRAVPAPPQAPVSCQSQRSTAV